MMCQSPNVEPEIDTSKPEGRIILTTLSMVAEMELTFIKERRRAGIEAAKAKGVYKVLRADA